ncbi:hypothetical protein D3C76_876950 [compost metagenome]
MNRHSDLSQLDVWVAQHLAQDVQPATQQCLDPFCLEQLCGVLPGDAPAVRDRVDEQRHVEFRIAARLGQHLHLQVGQVAVRKRHVVHHEQDLHQRVHTVMARRGGGLDDQVERQCLLGAGIEQGGAGARQPGGEVQLLVQLRTQRQDVDEEADQRLQVRVLAAGNVGAEQQVVLAAGAVHQQLERRQQQHVGRYAQLRGAGAHRLDRGLWQVEVEVFAGLRSLGRTRQVGG